MDLKAMCNPARARTMAVAVAMVRNMDFAVE